MFSEPSITHKKFLLSIRKEFLQTQNVTKTDLDKILHEATFSMRMWYIIEMWSREEDKNERLELIKDMICIANRHDKFLKKEEQVIRNDEQVTLVK